MWKDCLLLTNLPTAGSANGFIICSVWYFVYISDVEVYYKSYIAMYP
jgi:hypothetical protein